MTVHPPFLEKGPWPEAMVARVGQEMLESGSRTDGTLAGLSGSPGSGKTTLGRQVVGYLASQGLPAILLSLDDFYLTPQERTVLARASHPALKNRGLPGTHDIDRLCQAIHQLQTNQAVALPRFDKARDDRLPPGVPIVHRRPHVILLEGWCLGCRPLPPVSFRAAGMDSAGARIINQAIDHYQQALFSRIDRLWFLQAPDWCTVEAWRFTQEFSIPDPRARMSRVQVNDFLAFFRPLVHDMILHPPANSRCLRLDHRRRERAPRPR